MVKWFYIKYRSLASSLFTFIPYVNKIMNYWFLVRLLRSSFCAGASLLAHSRHSRIGTRIFFIILYFLPRWYYKVNVLIIWFLLNIHWKLLSQERGKKKLTFLGTRGSRTYASWFTSPFYTWLTWCGVLWVRTQFYLLHFRVAADFNRWATLAIVLNNTGFYLNTNSPQPYMY